MRILHISDFHYQPKAKAEYERVVEKIADSLRNQEKIDFIVFTGDLVHKDASAALFKEAADCLFNPIFEAAGLTKECLLLCPGNHDLVLTDEMPMVKESLDAKTTTKGLDDFCNNSQQLELSLTRFVAYKTFINEYFGDTVNSQPLYECFVRERKGKKVGFVALNSAWRCVESAKDRGNLLFPVRYVHEAMSNIKQCDMVLCAMHHNISDFRFFIEKDIEDVIYDNCHLLFTGHYHKGKLSTVLTPNGLLHSSGYATFNRYDGVSQYGYHIIDIDEETFDVKVSPFQYIGNQVVDLDVMTTMMPVSEAKREANEFRKLMRRHLEYYREKADNLFVKGKTDGVGGHTFQTLFIDPIIKDKSLQEILATKKSGNRISLDDIENGTKDTVVFGRGKSGRTSLLYKLMLDYLADYSVRKVIPYYISYSDYENGANSLDLINKLRQYLEISRNKTIDTFKTYTLVLLIDGLDVEDKMFLKNLGKEMTPFAKVRIIATAEETLAEQTLLSFFENVETKNYFIHDVTPREVHQLALRWPNMPLESKRQYEEKIVKILHQMHMPFNYWTVSLFLWIFETNDPSNIHNNFELINLYIDEILDKPGIILNKNFTVEYDDLRSFLAALAEFLLKHDNHRVKYTDLVNFTDNYICEHKKFTEQTRVILDLLISKGILVEEKPLNAGDTLYTFRLNGVFEYFIALRMKENKELKDTILGDDCTFFSFGTELELYSGFEKEDTDAVKSVFEKTQKILEPISSTDEYTQIDQRLVQEIVIVQDSEIPTKIVNQIPEMTKEEADELLPILNIPFNETKVTAKTILKEIPATLSNIEKALFILSRMYRNSNVCNHKDLSDAILDFVLDGVCNMGFMLPEDVKSFRLSEEDYKKYVQMISNIMPIIVQTYFYDAISQQNLVRVFEGKLNELRRSPEGNQFKIFIMTFIIVDLNPRANMQYIEESLKCITNRVLRFACANKLMLLMLNEAQDKEFVARLKSISQPVLKEFDRYKEIQEKIDKELSNKALKDSSIKALDSSDYEKKVD